MCRYRKVKKIVVLLSLLAVASGLPAFSAQSAPTSGVWQETKTSTGEVVGTSPQADSATIAVYQGSVQLDPAKTHTIPYSATPGDFSADVAANHLILTNPHDIEGDLFATPPDLQWENQQPPGADLVWADIATPETPLDPQPVDDKSFCAQHLAGRHLVVWPQLNSVTPPLLYLTTLTGTPTTGTVALQDQRVAIDITSAGNDPLTVSASHYDSTLKAAKVKAGESITLTIATQDCAGNALGNVAFVIMRSEAIGRQTDVVNNSNPVHVGNTELTTTDTEYRGVTDANGTATITVTQDNGPGVKTTLKVKPSTGSTQEADVDVIFTTLTSPDTDKAAMWGHMAESTTIGDFTYSRPKLAAEASGTNGVVADHNETWALFGWNNANSHCNTLLPDLKRLVTLDRSQGTQTIQETLGWPVEGHYYWSGSPGDPGRHFAVDMQGEDGTSSSDSKHYLVSCVDHAIPAVIPKITLTPDHVDTTLGASKVMTSESITMTVLITDSTTGEPLPHVYYTLQVNPGHSRADEDETNTDWEASPVAIAGEQLQKVDSHLYEGVTDADGGATVVLTQPKGAGVRTTITAGMREGYTATDSKDVIFTVITSPDNENAHMWGHMKNAVVAGGDAFVRPLLAKEAVDATGSYSENNESWATFNAMIRAQQQCGEGELPSVTSLQSLYAAYPDKKLETDQGWPSEGASYLAADTNGSTYHNVSLATGTESSFSGYADNYLTCSATELVAQLQVTTNGDATPRLAKAKAGEAITLVVHTTNAVTGQPAPNVVFTVTSAASTNRQGSATGFTSGGPLIVNGQSFGVNSTATGTYQGETDEQGQAQLIIEQPAGPGVKTPLTIKLGDSQVADAINYDVIFTAVTSPDSDKAQMWGHMDDSVMVGNNTFFRPKLASEFTSPPGLTNTSVNEVWGRLDHSGAMSSAAGGCETGHLPSSNQMLALYNANPNDKLHSVHGWPVTYSYWTSTLASGTSGNWNSIYMTPGTVNSSAASAILYVSCLKEANPVAAQLTLEAVDSAQWSSSLNAARAKKGDTLQIKLTAKDGAGNPAPYTPVVLSRADDYPRKGEAKESSPTSMVINGQSLSNTSSLLNASTGADGSLILEIARPDTKGTKAAITAKLLDNASVTASMDTIFTVVTSPDSAKAKYWGHMPETLTAEDGTVFKRPLLFSEWTNTDGLGRSTENNEEWGLANYAKAQDSGVGGCGIGYIPAKSALESLYAAWPGNTINSTQGWPSATNYWSDTADSSNASIRYYKTVNLRSNTSTGETSTQTRLLSCVNQPNVEASQIDMSSPQYVAVTDTLSAAKAPKGSKITLLVTTRDAQGNPMPNTAFTLTRNTSTTRSDTTYTSSISYLDVAVSGGQMVTLARTTDKFFGVTDNSGQAQLDIAQNSSPGLETTLTATLENSPTATKDMPVIFTVATSPDSDKAVYWGHMPETLTAANGIDFKRPRLFDELPKTSGFVSTSTAGEKWAAFNYAQAQDSNAGGCGDDYIPEQSSLDSLYSVWPSGAITSTQGWPSGTSYWSSTVDTTSGSTRYKGVSLNTDASSNMSPTQTLMLTCQIQKKESVSRLEVSSEQYVDTLSAARTAKGSTITLLVTTRDALGNPAPNTAFSLTRDISINRVEVPNTSMSSYLYVSASGGQRKLMVMRDKFNYVTDNTGHLQLDITQDSTIGLKTPLTAMLDSDNSVVQAMPVIFTVITSPDSDEAKFWGHMPETFTASNGTEFSRPLLYDEYPAAAAAGSYTTAGETWPLTTPDKMDSGACPRDQMPLLSDLKSLYSDHPNNDLVEDLGLPTNSPWWAGDEKAAGLTASTANYQYLNMWTGVAGSTTSTTAKYMQVCLTKPSGMLFTVTFPTAKWDAEKQATVVGMNEKVSATVAVTDTSGKPVSGALVRISAGGGVDRKENPVSNAAKTVTETAPVQASGNLPAGGVYNGVTGDDGKAVFDISQADYASKETLTFSVGGSDVKTQDIIVTTPNSPDSPYAKNWGSMAETIEVNGVTYKRPMLLDEYGTPAAGRTSSGVTLSDEVWATFTPTGSSHVDIVDACGSYIKTDFPQVDDIKDMYTDKRVGSGAAAGWPYATDGSTTGRYLAWNANTGGYQLINMMSGAASLATVNSNALVSCPVR